MSPRRMIACSSYEQPSVSIIARSIFAARRPRGNPMHLRETKSFQYFVNIHEGSSESTRDPFRLKTIPSDVPSVRPARCEESEGVTIEADRTRLGRLLNGNVMNAGLRPVSSSSDSRDGIRER